MNSERKDCAAIMIDAELSFDYEWDEYYSRNYISGLLIFLPFNLMLTVLNNEEIQSYLKNTFLFIANGHVWNNMQSFPIYYRIKLLQVEKNWQKTIKFLIAKSKDLNQGLVTEKAFARKGREPIIYNEIKFASQSEIRIAQELEAQGVLFFPLPLAVRHETGNIYEDHREVDFLVCLDGTSGILEISFHEGRYEKDKEKDAWFKKSGILCIEHYPAEKCYHQPKVVVEEFLSFLSKHKR
ncbi:hypothetical protein GNE08_17195 [Trichormus variabilis ARAD]|uniref:DUF559 domain-containing protein n=1 Tax=Trichormus variabilis N2B TaxID=2681315 RepID=A0ABR6SCJ7_ANAVA|nr:hypothetical protein [Trichormus variabilis ARAD]MBC1267865.1 hypothetical protein [Trichormus variabilis FSR]MBC1304135.1 hypothetical protein [Trichormus variabilis N2B]MBC1327145.1 hypothetical protein [Trichormus variabilis 9RC]MBD2382353.1 hypothetical protein [Trichormus variabilis FACHB-319]QFZ15817.1 hypothetical protein EH233_10120 [Anabaena sp. YBS01]QHD83269.1 hypothetical protein GSQ19_17390 [Trichormus variabilis 0441]